VTPAGDALSTGTAGARVLVSSAPLRYSAGPRRFAGNAPGEVRKRTRWMKTPNVIRLDQRGPRGTYVLFFDGGLGAGSEILPELTGVDPYRTAGKAIALAGGELEFAKGALSGFELNQWLADRLPGYVVTSLKALSCGSNRAAARQSSRSIR